ncbi:acyltransferase family protein [Bacillus atrophaeus]|uniref:acyltransferase family protein n=1 Tax=Bacillus atrophaeus TaxID=1452 RepID=UPI002E1C8A7A|nr:acyltransferase family protein [Bacillus atrophaeus]
MKGRVEWIDISKGIGIILVVLGHAPTDDALKSFIFSFHMPMFFFLSGAVYRDTGLGFFQFALKKARGLLVPYAVFSVITYLFWLLVERHFQFLGSADVDPAVPLKGIVYSIPDHYMLTHNPALWFLTCLFLVDIVFFLLKKACRGKWLILIAGSCLVSVVNVYVLHISLLWNAEVAAAALGFYTIGFVVRNKLKELSYRRTIFAVVVCFSLTALLQMENTRVDMRANEYGNMLIFYLTAALGTGGVVFASFKLRKLAFLQFLGRNSLIILVLHYPILRTMEAVVYYVLNIPVPSTYQAGWGILYTAATFAALVPFIFFFKRYPVLFGKPLAKRRVDGVRGLFPRKYREYRSY